jgi:anti-sigma-K factor RskA
MSADIDDMTLIKIQEQIAAVGNGVTELRVQFSNMDAKLDRMIGERQVIVQRVSSIESQLVPKEDISRLSDKVREIEPFLKFFRWGRGVFIAAVAAFFTGLLLIAFFNMKAGAERSTLEALKRALQSTGESVQEDH